MPTERLGLSLALREEMYGDDWTPIVPAFFADFVLSKKGNVVAVSYTHLDVYKRQPPPRPKRCGRRPR